jgi:hypothetical protein
VSDDIRLEVANIWITDYHDEEAAIPSNCSISIIFLIFTKNSIIIPHKTACFVKAPTGHP